MSKLHGQCLIALVVVILVVLIGISFNMSTTSETSTASYTDGIIERCEDNLKVITDNLPGIYKSETSNATPKVSSEYEMELEYNSQTNKD